MMDGGTLKAMLGWGTATRALLADIAAAIREHTAEMRESEARIEKRAAQRAEDEQVAAERRDAVKREADDARMAPYNAAVQEMMQHLSEMEANTERRQIESEGRADLRLAAMEKRINGGGY